MAFYEADQPHDRGKRSSGRLHQLGEQRPGVFQIGRIEALGEPAVEGREQVARLVSPALLGPQPGEARGGAQFVASRALLRAIAKAVRNESSALAGSGCGKRPLRSPRKR